MDEHRLTVEVAPSMAGEARLAMQGDVDIAADEALAAAYARAADAGATRIVLDFARVGYINSTGIALIVRLLAEARRDRPGGDRASACPTTIARSSGSRACPTT